MRIRYSLRTLLVAFAILSAWIAFHANRGRFERSVEREILSIGGKVSVGAFDWSKEQTPRPLHWYYRVFCRTFGERHIVIVDLKRTRVDAELMERVCQLPYLEVLDASDCGLTDQETVLVMQAKGLVGLTLRGNEISDRGIGKIESLRQLRFVDLTQTQVGDETLEGLLLLPRLETVSLSLTKVRGHGATSIAGRDFLRSWSAEQTPTSDALLKVLATCPRLQRLNLERTDITDDGVASLRNHNNLEYVYLSGSNLSDESLETLATLPSLKRVGVGSTHVTRGGIGGFRAKRPGVSL